MRWLLLLWVGLVQACTCKHPPSAPSEFASGVHANQVGEKIFAKVTQIYTTSIAGLEASDTVSLGTGSKVGITKMFSTDLHELKQASLVNAAGTGITAITINTTNFDSTYHALKAAAFGGAVTDGDTVALLFLTDTSTPDDRYFPGR